MYVCEICMRVFVYVSATSAMHICIYARSYVCKNVCIYFSTCICMYACNTLTHTGYKVLWCIAV